MESSAMTGDSQAAPVTTTSQVEASGAVLIFTLLLLTTLLAGYFIRSRRIYALHESLVATWIGIAVGLIIHFAGDDSMQQLVTFDHRYFFNLLRPPMILNSGYEMDVAKFYRNIGVVFLFAFLGTFVSAAVLGVLLFIAVGWLQITGPSHAMGFLQCLIFGAILSSTDPITMLSIFNYYNVDLTLKAIIWGESVVNNAVSIVLYNILEKFHGLKITFGSVMYGVVGFFAVFVGSSCIGIFSGLGTAVLLAHTQLYKNPALESCIVTLLAFTSYFFANSVGMTGMVSLLFTGISMKRYCHPILSRPSQKTLAFLFKLLAYLAENFVFIYLGLSSFNQKGDYNVGLTIIIFVFSLVARAATVFPLSSLANYWSSSRNMRWRLNMREPVVIADDLQSVASSAAGHVIDPNESSSRLVFPNSHQVILWWSALRGAIAIALCMNIESEALQEMRASTLWVVVLSIVVFGGTTSRILTHFGIYRNEYASGRVLQDTGSSSQRQSVLAESQLHGRQSTSSSSRTNVLVSDKTSNVGLPSNGRRDSWMDFEGSENWFLRLDKSLMHLLYRQDREDLTGQSSDDNEDENDAGLNSVSAQREEIFRYTSPTAQSPSPAGIRLESLTEERDENAVVTRPTSRRTPSPATVIPTLPPPPPSLH